MASPASSPELPRAAPWVALASIGVVAALAVVAWPWLERRRGRMQGTEARAALTRCLGTTSDEALRARAIAADIAGEPWPSSCLAPSAALEVALRRVRATLPTCHGGCCVDDTACQELEANRARLRRLREQLTTGHLHGGVAAAVLGPVNGPSPPLPPKAADLVPLVDSAFDATALAVAAKGPNLLLHDRGRRADVCVLDIASANARCRPLPASIPVDGEVLLVDGAPSHPLRLLVGEAEGRWSLRTAKGASLVRWSGAPVSATFDAALVRREEGFEVVGADARRAVGAGPAPLLYGEHVYRANEGSLRRWVRWEPERVDAVALEGVAPSDVRLQPCQGEPGTRLVATGDDGTGTPASAVIFDEGALVVQPVPSTPPWYGLTCHGEEVSLTWIGEHSARAEGDGVRGRYPITRIRCGPRGCERGEAEVALGRHRRSSRYVVADLGDAVALVWRSRFGDVRLRVAPLDELATAPTVSLFDDAAHGGLAWDGRAAALVPGNGYAVLVAQAEGGPAYGWLVQADGARPLVPLPAP